MAAPARSPAPSPAASPAVGAPVTPQRIFESVWGGAEAATLATALELDLFTLVQAGNKTAEALAKAAKASPRGVRMVADAMTGLGLLTKRGDAYALAPDAALFLVRTSPASLADFLVFQIHEVAESWRTLTDCVRTGKPVAALDKPAEGIPFWHRLVDGLFALSFQAARFVGEELGRRRPGKAARLLDVAAGSGVWGIGAALANPNVTVVATDLEETLTHARRWAERTKTTDRVSFLAGDQRSVDFGTAAFDAAVLGHICHCEGPVHTPRLLAKVGRALRPGGTIVIAEFVPDDGRAAPLSPLLFALNMLVHTSEGDTFTPSEYRAWLEAAGFRDVTHVPAPSVSPLIFATKA